MFILAHRSTPVSSLIVAAIVIMMMFVAQTLAASPAITSGAPAAPKINAKSYILQDFNSGKIIVHSNEKTRMEPASLTKLMTAYIVFNELQSKDITLNDDVLISEKAWKMPGSRMFIEVNKRVSVENLLKGMIIQSGNDASVALAEYVAGSEDAFASLMNQYTKTLGMNDSNFVNSTGMPDPDHYTTAVDMAILARAIIKDFPDFFAWYSVKTFTFNNITQRNRNLLLWRDKYVDGLKTGHTESAGFCLIATAQKDNMRLITVVLGTKSENARSKESQKLLNYGFRFFNTQKLYTANTALTTTRVWKGISEKLSLGISDDLYITTPRKQLKNVQSQLFIKEQIIAPVTKGQPYGNVNIMLGEEIIATRELVSLSNIEEGGMIQQLIDELKLMLE